MSRTITASCHCGGVKLRATLIEDTLNPSRCTCSFCSRRQAGNVSVLTASVVIETGAHMLGKYQFGTHTAEHFFCKTCGIYTHHKRRSDPLETGVNIGCVEGAEPWTFEPMHWHDGVNHPSDT